MTTPDSISLKLYITGHTAVSQRAIADSRRICEANFHGRFELGIIDVLEQPELAHRDGILATPTLVKAQPGPACRIVGDLSNTEKVLAGLGVESAPDSRVPGDDMTPG